MKLFLQLIPAQSPRHQSRLRYAFRLFCAVYDHTPILDGSEAGSADLWVTYSKSCAAPAGINILTLHNGYRVRPLSAPAARPDRFRGSDAATVLFYRPEHSMQPDWLAEMFEWVSCADEYSITARDSVGRIPFRDTVFARYNLDERTPWAAVAMSFLQRAICGLVPRADTRAKAPQLTLSHAVVCSHDVDFLPDGHVSSVARLAANVVIALREFSPGLALGITSRTLRLVMGGSDPFLTIEGLAGCEQRAGTTSSFFFLVQHRHSRDANYTIETPGIPALMDRLKSMGMDVGVHGSYTALESHDGLAAEFECARRHGFRPIGLRQHWLRFTLDRFIPAVESARALCDASVGWQDRIGFRAGACFPFPPYNFAEERPARFLEFPLAVMDQAVPSNRAHAVHQLSELLRTSRGYGWGGISLLWHPAAFGGVQLDASIGTTFFDLLELGCRCSDKWMSAAQLLCEVRKRYIDVGLMTHDWGADLKSVGTGHRVA